MKNLDELYNLVENTWGDDNDMVDSLVSFLGNDLELVSKVISEDATFNRYYTVSSWRDLLNEILYDESFKDEDLSVYKKLECKGTDKDIENFLVKLNWCINSKCGIAVGFDDGIPLVNNFI